MKPLLLQKNTQGFSLLEAALSLAIIIAIAGVMAPSFLSSMEKNDLSLASEGLRQSLWRAQELSRASDGDSPWGVRILPGEIIVFQGANYAARNAAFDEIHSVPAGILFSGLSEVVFSKFSGDPQTRGTTTLTLMNESQNVAIKHKGAVQY